MDNTLCQVHRLLSCYPAVLIKKMNMIRLLSSVGDCQLTLSVALSQYPLDPPKRPMPQNRARPSCTTW